ncbi:MAG TPA: polyketide synthase dehydratase domain-containing protein, partial [Elusimicrobiales bacterium]|nr:polyketide synthase dehydratase domain-containing protein [Elusimicrobiales bacterium]
QEAKTVAEFQKQLNEEGFACLFTSDAELEDLSWGPMPVLVVEGKTSKDLALACDRLLSDLRDAAVLRIPGKCDATGWKGAVDDYGVAMLNEGTYANSLEKDGTLAVFRRPQAPLFKGERPKLVFHPMVIEAAFQACGYRDIHFERKMTLPDSVGRVTVYPYENEPDILYLKTVYKGRDGEGRSIYDAFAFDEAHNLVAEVRDYLMIPTQI